jgi:prevent-host-death family protein
MTKRISAAQAKAQLSALVGRVAYRGEHYVIERRGKPLAALVSVDDLERLEQGCATSARPQGALAIVDACREVDDQDLDALVADIHSERARDSGRPVSLDA